MSDDETPAVGPLLVRDFLTMGQVRGCVRGVLETALGGDQASDEIARQVTIALGSMELSEAERGKMRGLDAAAYISQDERDRLSSALGNPSVRALLVRLGFEMTPVDSFAEKLKLHASIDIALEMAATFRWQTHQCAALKKRIAELEATLHL